MLHNRPLPVAYAKVSIDELAKGRYRAVELDLPEDEDRKTLGQNLGSFVAWRKCYISFGSDSECDDNEDDERGEQ